MVVGDVAVLAGPGPVEQGVAGIADYVLEFHVERFQSCTVHPYQCVLGIMDEKYVLDLVHDHVEEGLSVVVVAHLISVSKIGLSI